LYEDNFRKFDTLTYKQKLLHVFLFLQEFNSKLKAFFKQRKSIASVTPFEKLRLKENQYQAYRQASVVLNCCRTGTNRNLIFKSIRRSVERAVYELLEEPSPDLRGVQNFGKGTFKYHTTLIEGVCSNGQSTVIWGRGVGQIVI